MSPIVYPAPWTDPVDGRVYISALEAAHRRQAKVAAQHEAFAADESGECVECDCETDEVYVDYDGYKHWRCEEHVKHMRGCGCAGCEP